MIDEALAISRELGDKLGILSCLILLNNITSNLGDLLTSRSLIEEKLAFAENWDASKAL